VTFYVFLNTAADSLHESKTKSEASIY